MTLKKVFHRLEKTDLFKRTLEDIQKGSQDLYLAGLAGSSRSLLAAALFSKLRTVQKTLLITPNVESASRVYGDLQTFLPSENIAYFPFGEVLPDEGLTLPPEVESQRLEVLNRMSEEPLLVVAPIQAVIPSLPAPKVLQEHTISLKLKQPIDRSRFIEKMAACGYQRAELVTEAGQFTIRGGIIDLFPTTRERPLRIELSGNKIISLRYFNPETQLSYEPTGSVTILPVTEKGLMTSEKAGFFLEYFPPGTLLVLWELPDILTEEKTFCKYFAGEKPHLSLETIRKARFPSVSLSSNPPSSPFAKGGFEGDLKGVSFHTESVTRFSLKGPVDLPDIWQKEPLLIFCRNESQSKRLKEVLAERRLRLHPESIVEIGYLAEGFAFPSIGLTCLSDSEIFGRYRSFRPGLKPFFQSPAIHTIEEIKPGDYVVHLNEGIGKFLSISHLKVDGKEEEVLKIEYADGMLLYVPVNQINLVHRYAGAEKPPVLSRLGSRAWLKTRGRVKEGIRDLASDLLRIYQYRKEKKGLAYPPDSAWQTEFEGEFIYEETPDQLTASKEVKEDLQSPKPMDRLICGDVGYGKTEVAMRAAFKIVETGKQVALLCPTTILAEQHLRTFRERFADFPVRIENLSRFRSQGEQKTIVIDLVEGRIEIIIGTHRLFSKDVRFKDLGLWIVDEEQRFGVTHKERLRARWPEIDILTLSATPIPRTMQLSLSGIRDLSVIETPPAGRQAILTFLSPYREDLIMKSCQRELERSGQVFFIHNRIENIDRIAECLRNLIPEAEIATAHGQMEEEDLAGVMDRFLDQKIDILVSTSIVESGLDIPTANTIIINNSQNFGLADLYQLRGRVGRYKSQAYCYLLYNPAEVLTEEARKRLTAIEEFSRLGSGLRLALADLEIRGAGNILGREQHGFIEAVGFYLYSQLFREAVAELTGQKVKSEVNISKIKGVLSEEYIPSEMVRLSLYRRIFGLSEDSGKLAREMADRFGPVPEETRKFLRSFTES